MSPGVLDLPERPPLTVALALYARPVPDPHGPQRLTRRERCAGQPDRGQLRGARLRAVGIGSRGDRAAHRIHRPCGAAFPGPFVPAVEIGWRLARPFWGHGYASEAVSRVLAFAFRDLGLPELVSFTSTTNIRSQAVMSRIGMPHDPADDSGHPLLEEGHPCATGRGGGPGSGSCRR